MFANRFGALILVALPLLLGCSGKDQPTSKGGVLVTNLLKKDSGYRSNGVNWREFLTCWKASALSGSAVGQSIELAGSRAPSESELEQAEARLGLKLPMSYRDFILTLEPSSLIGPDGGPGIYHPRHVDKVGKALPALVASVGEFAVESDDESYFVYGTEQDDAAGRTGYLADALIVGKYGTAEYEVILLYPQQRTVDGELEAALKYHAGEFRATSFAELLRQLSHFEVTRAAHVPPFSQESLEVSCAGRLKLLNVWWK